MSLVLRRRWFVAQDGITPVKYRPHSGLKHLIGYLADDRLRLTFVNLQHDR